MDETERRNKRHEENLRRLRDFCLMDDAFMTKCFESDPACAELVLQILLDKPDLQVLEVHTQVFRENLLNRSVRLDILACDSAGKRYNIEVQRSNRGADPRRARYHVSMIDSGLLEKNADFSELPELWVIFITEHDIRGKGAPLYPVERYFSGTDEIFGDGAHILYVNGSYRGGDDIGKLMHDFSCADPAHMHFPTLAERVRFFKEDTKGVAIMCSSMEELWNQAMEEGIQRGIQQGIQQGREQGIQQGREQGIQQGREQGVQQGVQQGIPLGEKKHAENMARYMLSTGEFPLEVISRCSGLPLTEVKRLRSEKSMPS